MGKNTEKKENSNHKSELFAFPQPVMQLEMLQGISNNFLINHRKHWISGLSHYTSNKTTHFFNGSSCNYLSYLYQCSLCSKDSTEKLMLMLTFGGTSNAFIHQKFRYCPCRANALFCFQGGI